MCVFVHRVAQRVDLQEVTFIRACGEKQRQLVLS